MLAGGEPHPMGAWRGHWMLRTRFNDPFSYPVIGCIFLPVATSVTAPFSRLMR